MSTQTRLAAAALCLALLGTAAARADDGPEQHRGFFLRMDLGLGYQRSYEAPYSITGGGGSFGLAIGGAVSENVILAFHLLDSVAVAPSFSNGSIIATASNDVSVGVVVYGANVTLYTMPFNGYLSLTLGPSKLALTENNQTYATNWGVGGRVQLGKEWWVSDNWGLGVAVHFTWSRNPDGSDNNSGQWTTWSSAVAFSATFN
ncbi:MAG: hypothetical protein JST92_24865 [Deltaproteobacteria bacterium]|nr:hypothetical protein [Deltaproteobacteria bacterium]